RTLQSPLDRLALQADIRDRLGAATAGDTEQEMELLRQFKHANVLRVAAADVGKAMPLMVVSDHLTEIAETVLGAALELAWRDVAARHGEPRCGEGESRHVVPFAVVGYGKLGGIELGYGSDLDLVFVHGSEGARQHTDGPREVDNQVFFGRLAQRIIHFLATLTPEGQLYEVDPRLRPSGSKGLIANSLESTERYLVEEAWTWEHQALVRARAVAGDRDLMERFAAMRR
ncbi:MAG: bifunctional glutamine synthetase adenylyltransferase/deadenyltransferase, partial [Alcanivoracaceae bacterium]|nr:bifunctional glutamine synthetase adenylyltransferase/deadenyltransferase [Alcanivoracaceae bacterium]